MYCPDFAIYGTKVTELKLAAAKDAKAAGGEK
jgi:hypothetical protein